MNAANPVTPRYSTDAATLSSPTLVALNDTDTHGWRDGRSSGALRWISHCLPSRQMTTRSRPQGRQRRNGGPNPPAAPVGEAVARSGAPERAAGPLGRHLRQFRRRAYPGPRACHSGGFLWSAQGPRCCRCAAKFCARKGRVGQGNWAGVRRWRARRWRPRVATSSPRKKVPISGVSLREVLDRRCSELGGQSVSAVMHPSHAEGPRRQGRLSATAPTIRKSDICTLTDVGKCVNLCDIM
jgi:hypothetical protein